MPIDRAAVDKLLADANRDLIPRLEDERFANPGVLIRRYRDVCAAWNRGGSETGAINETINEICVACELLGTETTSMLYEPILHNTNKTIDFLVTLNDRRSIYYDVKTVHPDDGDAWARYEDLRTHFTPRTDLILDQEWLGGEIAHDFFAARQRFLEHAVALEEKIAANTTREGVFYALVVCGSGGRWYEDQLEDFADFYRTGRHRPDDPFGDMETHFMDEKGLSLRGMIHSFCYMKRPLRSARHTVFHCNLRGPAFS